MYIRKTESILIPFLAFFILLSLFPAALTGKTEASSAKVYRPIEDGQFPVLLTRTLFNSGTFNNPNGGDYKNVGETFAIQGYVVVVNDVRGIWIGWRL
jgi:hypothetical protein